MINLTKQQKTMLDYMLEGKTLKQISNMLGVSYSRIINILNELLRKTGYKSRNELLANGKSLKINII